MKLSLIKELFNWGKQHGYGTLIIIDDLFDLEEVPIFLKPGENRSLSDLQIVELKLDLSKDFPENKHGKVN